MFFDSRRSTVLATNGMVATSQPLAAMAGLRVLIDGGNAVDAAIASAAVLNVVEPVSTGVGGDMFALVWNNKEKTVRAINGSGRSPEAASLESLRSRGMIRFRRPGSTP
jgi:gamma-glutamyltranspeptidase/glutathione hydrolase